MLNLNITSTIYLHISSEPSRNVTQNAPSAYVLQTVNPTVCINAFVYPTDPLFMESFHSPSTFKHSQFLMFILPVSWKKISKFESTIFPKSSYNLILTPLLYNFHPYLSNFFAPLTLNLPRYPFVAFQIAKF